MLHFVLIAVVVYCGLRASATLAPYNIPSATLVGVRDSQPCLVASSSLYCLNDTSETFDHLQSNVLDVRCAAARCFTLTCNATATCTLWEHKRSQLPVAVRTSLTMSAATRLIFANDYVLIVTDSDRELLGVYNLGANVQEQRLDLPDMVPALASIYCELETAAADDTTLVLHFQCKNYPLKLEVVYQRNQSGLWQSSPIFYWVPLLLDRVPFLAVSSRIVYMIPAHGDGLYSGNLTQAEETGDISVTSVLNFTEQQATQLQSITLVQSSFLFLRYSSRADCLEVRHNPLPHTAWAYIGPLCMDEHANITGVVGDGHLLHVLTAEAVYRVDTRSLPTSLLTPPKCARNLLSDCPPTAAARLSILSSSSSFMLPQTGSSRGSNVAGLTAPIPGPGGIDPLSTSTIPQHLVSSSGASTAQAAASASSSAEASTPHATTVIRSTATLQPTAAIRPPPRISSTALVLIASSVTATLAAAVVLVFRCRRRQRSRLVSWLLTTTA